MIERLRQISGLDVSRETYDTLVCYASLLVEASASQNLIAASTVEHLWERHIFDSAQMLRFARPGGWIDIGSGAGLPGIIVAILSREFVTLVEPRRLRVEFLREVKDRLSLTNVTVIHGKAATVSGKFDYITARAVAPASELLTMTAHLSHSHTVWMLPKGRTVQKELDDLRPAWQGEFWLEPSLTDKTSSILLATGVRRRGKR